MVKQNDLIPGFKKLYKWELAVIESDSLTLYTSRR